jgi:hypothetical protein
MPIYTPSESHTSGGFSCPQYYQHMKECRESLVTRFYGVYGVKEVGM